MGKLKQNKKKAQVKRRKMVEEVFKKSKKAKEIARKFDDKIAQRQGIGKKKDKFQEFKKQRKEGNLTKEKVVELDKKFDEIRANRKPGQIIL